MADPTTPTIPDPDPRPCPCAADVARLHAELAVLRTELTALRGGLAEGLSTRCLSVVDPGGHERIRLLAHDDHAQLVVRSHTDRDGDDTAVVLFALDAEVDDPGDHPYVGVELIDRGTSVAGASVSETRPPRLWSHHDA